MTTALQNIYHYQTQYLSFQDIAHILKTFKRLGFSTIKASITSNNHQLIQTLNNFIKKYQILNPIPHHFPKLNHHSDLIQVIKKKKYKRVVDLGNVMVAMIFMNQYRKKIKQLGDQFGLYMIEEGSIIKIFSDTPISTVFQSQLIVMKHKLKWIVLPNQNLYKKIKFSKDIRDALLTKKIKTLLLSHNQCVLLHSSQTDVDQMKHHASLFQYQTVILSFYNINFSNAVNQLYFQMLIWHSSSLFQKIQQDYQIKCEINKKRLGIIVHTRDPIFSEQPRQQLMSLLQNLIYISYYSYQPIDHILHFKNNTLTNNSLRYTYSKSFVYTSWNRLKQIKPSDVLNIYQKFFQQISQKTWLRIGFHTGGLSTGFIQNVQLLVEKYRLQYELIRNNEKIDNTIHVKFKTFNKIQKPRKIHQISQFLLQLIIRNYQPNNSFYLLPQSINNKIIQQNNHINNIFQQPSIFYIDNQLVNDNTQIIQHKQSTLLFDYQIPTIIISNNFTINNNKRNRKLQKKLEQQFGLISRIWNITISSNFYQPPSFQYLKQCQIYPTQSIQFMLHQKAKKPTILLFPDLKNDVQYYLISQLSNPEQYVPTHRMIIYQTL